MEHKNKHVGSSLEDFLREDGILEEARGIASEEALARQIERVQKSHEEFEVLQTKYRDSFPSA